MAKMFPLPLLSLPMYPVARSMSFFARVTTVAGLVVGLVERAAVVVVFNVVVFNVVACIVRVISRCVRVARACVAKVARDEAGRRMALARGVTSRADCVDEGKPRRGVGTRALWMQAKTTRNGHGRTNERTNEHIRSGAMCYAFARVMLMDGVDAYYATRRRRGRLFASSREANETFTILRRVVVTFVHTAVFFCAKLYQVDLFDCVRGVVG